MALALTPDAKKAEGINAEDLACRALSLMPNAAELWLLLGKHASTSKVQEYALNRALQLNARFTEAWIALAYLFHEHNKGDMAREALTQARMCDASSPQVWAGLSSELVSCVILSLVCDRRDGCDGNGAKHSSRLLCSCPTDG